MLEQLTNKEHTCIESCQIKFIASIDPPPLGPRPKNVMTHSIPSPHPSSSPWAHSLDPNPKNVMTHDSHPSPYTTPFTPQQKWYKVGGTDQTHHTFTEDSHSYEMALVREPFELTMVYNNALSNREEGRILVKRLIQTMIQTMKEHDGHWNCYTKQQYSHPGKTKYE